MIVTGNKDTVWRLKGLKVKSFNIKEVVYKNGKTEIVSWKAEIIIDKENEDDI